MENWNRFLYEADEGENAGMTWGQLHAAIRAAEELQHSEITAERKRELKLILGEQALNLALSFAGPLGQLVRSAKSIGGAVAKMFQVYAQEPDTETTDNPLLAALNLSDGFQELIDDRLEDAFIKEMMPEIEKQAEAAPDTPIPNMDRVIQTWLRQQDLGDTTGNTVQNVEIK